jgi:hypothetical protein
MHSFCTRRRDQRLWNPDGTVRWEGHVARMGDRRSAYRVLVGKPEGRRRDDNIKTDLYWSVLRAWTGSMWLRTAIGHGLLWMLLWTFGFHKMWGVFWLAENLLASREGFFPVKLVMDRIVYFNVQFQSKFCGYFRILALVHIRFDEKWIWPSCVLLPTNLSSTENSSLSDCHI